MKSILLVAFGFGAIGLASPASAKQYYYCYTKVYNTDTLIHYSPILASDVDRIDDRQTGFAFSDFAQSTARSNGSIDTGCSSSSRLDVISRYYEAMLKDAAGSGAKVDWPNPPVGSSVTVASSNEVSITFSDSTRAAVNSGVQPRYVEVDGAQGKMRLSPEVIARNRAAEDEFRRKSDEYASAKAEHERKLVLHQQSIAAASAEKRAYEQKLAMNSAEVATHAAALAQHAAAASSTAKGAKGWMYCEARGEIGSKRRYYSRIAQVDYTPGEISIVDVMAKNRIAFKSYLSGTHKVFFGTDTLLHCPYSTDDLAEAQSLEARDKRGDGNNGIEVIQTGWLPAS